MNVGEDMMKECVADEDENEDHEIYAAAPQNAYTH